MRNEKQNAAPVLQHQDGSGEQIALQGFELPDSKSTTVKPEEQGLISSLLPCGANQAVSLQRLAELTGLSMREVRRAIQRERLRGAPICSNNLTGYYLAADDSERAAFCQSMRHRARQILKAAQAVERGCVH